MNVYRMSLSFILMTLEESSRSDRYERFEPFLLRQQTHKTMTIMQMSSTPPPAAPPAIAGMLSVDSGGVVGGKHSLVTTPLGQVHDLSALPQFILHWLICAVVHPSCEKI